MEHPAIECDLEESRRYYDALEAYYYDRVLRDGTCTCKHLAACETSAGRSIFAAAQLSFVGEHYAMVRQGRPLRIVVVSMQVGEPETPITMTRRRSQFAGRLMEPFAQRNAHIKGVTSALRVLWGRDAGTDPEGEFLETPDGRVHVLDAHALVNTTLCSSIMRPGSRTGAGSDDMHRNCVAHLRSALEILEPTIVHSQGRRKAGNAPTPHTSMLAVLGSEIDWHSDCVATGRVGERPIVWVSLGHPSARGKVAWQHPASPYFQEVVDPELRRARDLARGIFA